MSSPVAEYDDEAASYDESRFRSRLGRHLDYMHKRIVKNMLGQSEKLVLEVGVGTGRFATWLVQMGHEVIGTDISIGMLRKAKSKARKAGLDLDLVQSDLHFLPFRESVFDTCICINVVDHISDFDGFVKEISIVEKRGSTFIFNISNMMSPYLPVALAINLTNKAFFRGGRINSRWVALNAVVNALQKNSFRNEQTKGCMIASPIPVGERLVKVVELLNISLEDSWLRSFSGSIFIKARLGSRPSRIN